jgi:hypothetical protein
MIRKGTLVAVTTTNGGFTVGRLERDYRPSYGVELEGFALPIPSERLREVVAVGLHAAAGELALQERDELAA